MNTATTTEQFLAGTEALEKIREVLKNFRSTMMVTRAGDQLHSRPMGLLGQAGDFDGTLWFFTDDRSHKLTEVEGGHAVWLVFQSDKHNCYMQLDGTARVVKDKAKMKELFKPIVLTWFPDGLDDPHRTLIRFDAHDGTYWDTPGGMLQVLAAFTKSVLTGRPGNAGETKDLRL